MNKAFPLVSIVIPTYNQHEVFLRESIESAINQTYNNIEIVISDNHCTNGASEIIAEYAKSDQRIRIVKPSKFLSLSDNFIFAYGQIKGDFICPLSSDDILYPNLIKEQIAPFFSNPSIKFCFSIPKTFNDQVIHKQKSNKFKTGFYTSEDFLKLYLKKSNASFGGVIFKNSDFQKIGGFQKDIKISFDFDTFIKLALLNGGCFCINKPLSAIRYWFRDEINERMPLALQDLGLILRNLERTLLNSEVKCDIKLAQSARRKIFLHELYPIPYFIQFNKKPISTIESAIEIIKSNYNYGIFKFVLRNKKNPIGLIISIIYLSIMKIKIWSNR